LVHIAQHIAEEAGFLALFGKLCPASSMLDSIPANNNHDLCMNISAITPANGKPLPRSVHQTGLTRKQRAGSIESRSEGRLA
jgi:hypothetical protein